MKLVNVRTLNLIRSERFALLWVVACGVAAGLLVVLAARLTSRVIGAVFLHSRGLADLSSLLYALLGVYLLRAALVFAEETSAGRLAARLKFALRSKIYNHIHALGPNHFRELDPAGDAFTTGGLSAVLLEGVDSLEAYVSQYLPGLALAGAIPLAYLAIVLPIDLLSGIVLLLTAPLIPVFMMLIGAWAQNLTQKRWETLQRLSDSFLDLIQGLPTLKMLGRSRQQTEAVGRISQRYRTTTMSVLQVTFLSALALELIATLSTAVVAVEIALRLLHGSLDFERALFILILAPEFYLPLRRLGARFHAAMDGDAAVRSIFSILDAPVPQPATRGSSNEERKLPTVPLSIAFEDVSFAYTPGRPALDGLSLRIEKGKTVILTGPSGSGKSTLAHMLLGFVSPQHGQVLVNGFDLADMPSDVWRRYVAWVPQRPHLFNASVMANIRLARPNASLEEVHLAAQRAGVDEFVDRLPQGYATLIGENGARLSGGQAQRIALARAFLKDAPIIILDEPGAHLDPVTEAQLYEILEMLLANRTGLVISHRRASHVLPGRIVHMRQGRILPAGVSSPSGEWDREQGWKSDLDGSFRAQTPLPLPQPSSAGAFEQSLPSGVLRPERAWPILRRMLPLIVPYASQIVMAVFCGAATVLAGVGLLGTGAYLISAAALMPSIALLQVPIVGVRFFGLARGVFRYLERYLTHDTSLRLLAGLRVRFYAALEPRVPARTSDYFSGDLLSRTIDDVKELEDFFVRTIAPPLIAALVALGLAIWMATFYWVFAPVLLLAFALYVAIVAGVSWSIGWITAPHRATWRAELSASLVDGIQGMPDLAVYAGGWRHRENVVEAARRLASVEGRIALGSGLRAGLDTLLADLGVWAVLVSGIYASQTGAFDPVYLATITLASYAGYEALRPLPLAVESWRRHLLAAQRLFEFEQLPVPVSDPPAALPIPARPEFEFNHLAFAYDQGGPPVAREVQAVSTSHWQLEDFSLCLEPGKKLAVVGASGAGKSTLLNLLLRLWEAPPGRLLLDGRDICLYSQEEVRSLFAVVPQHTYLFSASLRQNVLLGNPKADDSQLDRALRRAALDEFVEALPRGLDTWVGEHGLRLSGGQRRRICIARALVRDAPYALFDEPTAHLDPHLAGRLMDTVLDWGQERGVLLLTHDLRRLEHFDELLVLDGGRVVERGAHQDLVQQGGKYAQFWALQNKSH